jgi:hypothetical protein
VLLAVAMRWNETASTCLMTFAITATRRSAFDRCVVDSGDDWR